MLLFKLEELKSNSCRCERIHVFNCSTRFLLVPVIFVGSRDGVGGLGGGVGCHRNFLRFVGYVFVFGEIVHVALKGSDSSVIGKPKTKRSYEVQSV